jgi:hypothetical protein
MVLFLHSMTRTETFRVDVTASHLTAGRHRSAYGDQNERLMATVLSSLTIRRPAQTCIVVLASDVVHTRHAHSMTRVSRRPRRFTRPRAVTDRDGCSEDQGWEDRLASKGRSRSAAAPEHSVPLSSAGATTSRTRGAQASVLPLAQIEGWGTRPSATGTLSAQRACCCTRIVCRHARHSRVMVSRRRKRALTFVSSRVGTLITIR